MSTSETTPCTDNPVVRDIQTLENYNPLAKQKAAAKLSRIPVKVESLRPAEVLKKPDWIRVKAGSPSTRFYEIKDILRANKLVTVCEEASCPNIGECFGKGTATFMIMGHPARQEISQVPTRSFLYVMWPQTPAGRRRLA